MFESFTRERQIRKALKIIAGQRVVLILQPGNVFVIENSPMATDWFEQAVQTCRIRGWVDVLHEGTPSAPLEFQGRKPIFDNPTKPTTFYRLTDGGWNAIHRSHALLIVTVILSTLSLAAGAASVVLAVVQMSR